MRGAILLLPLAGCIDFEALSLGDGSAAVVDAGDASVLLDGAKVIDAGPPDLTPLKLSFATTDYPAGISPLSIVAGDFDRDGLVDVMVANFSSSLTLLRGLGAGQLGAPRSFATPFGTSQYFVTAADFNGDGHLDLVLPGDDLLLWVDDPRLFASAGTWPKPGDASSGLPADLDGDGNMDLVIGAGPNVAVLRGDGKGALAQMGVYPCGSSAGKLVGGDFNSDGKLDVAVANSDTNADTMAVLLGNGDGTFGPTTYYKGFARPGGLAGGDLDRDGRLDLAMLTVDRNLHFLRGLGDGTFHEQVVVPMAGWEAVALADFDQDGQLDAAAVASANDYATVLLRYPNGDFQPPLTFPVGHIPTSMVMRDLDGDGKPDLVVGNLDFDPMGHVQPSTVTVLLNTSR